MTNDKYINELDKETVKCIYCGKSKHDGIELNTSDIFPASLTNEKLKNKNVCSIEHNKRFGESFESEAINPLKRIRNHLNITNYSNKYPNYRIMHDIEGQIYERTISNEQEILKKGIVKSTDKKTLFGPIDELRKMSNFNEENLRELNVNEADMTISNPSEAYVYLTYSMKRMIAKIGYEWHCKLEGINDRYSEYDLIIKYITEEQSKNQPDDIVHLITEPFIYESLGKYLPLGNHLLFRINNHDKIFVYICLFGIAIYEVEIRDSKISDNRMIELRELSQAKNIKTFKEPFKFPSTILKIVDIIEVFSGYFKPSLMQKTESEIQFFLTQNIINLLNQNYVTRSSLQRFVKDYKLLDREQLEFNYNNQEDESFWYFLNIVYCLSEFKSDAEVYDIKTISDFILDKIPPEKYSSFCFKQIFQKDENNLLRIKIGSEIILKIVE